MSIDPSEFHGSERVNIENDVHEIYKTITQQSGGGAWVSGWEKTPACAWAPTAVSVGAVAGIGCVIVAGNCRCRHRRR